MRYLKALGLAMVAALAISAIGASAASAEFTFTSAAGETILTGEESNTGAPEGEGNHVFEVGGIPLTCETTHFEGTEVGEELDEVTIEPTYEECEFGGNPLSVTMNGCDYTFTGATGITNEGEENEEVHGTVHLDCSTEGAGPVVLHLELFGAACEVTIPGQEATDGVTYTNVTGSPKEVLVHATAVVHTSTWHGGGLCGSFSGAPGTYTGTTLLKGYEDLGGEGHENLEEGEQVDITVNGAPDHE